MKKTFFAFFLLSLSSVLYANTAPSSSRLTDRADVKNFVAEMVRKHDFEANALNKYLASATIQPTILAAISKPAEKLPWHRYEKIFISSNRVTEGVSFWKKNKSFLEMAEKKYGIPPEIIVAIIGVETFYGKQTGKYRVLDSLVTLGFDYPPRSKFFLSELEEFLLLSREENWDPTQMTGSYAGAMGKPQFISSSYRRYAVDFNNHGKRDLINNDADAIGSVANYFKVHGWKSGEVVVIPAKAKGTQHNSLIASKMDPKPEHTLQTLMKQGITPKQKTRISDRHQPFAFIKLEGEQGPEYWLGAQNFYVITRYNHSDHYAMAVYTLSQHIKEAYYS